MSRISAVRNLIDMKKFYYIMAIVAAAVVATGCHKKLEPTLEIVPSSQSADYRGGVFEFQIKCNTVWSVEDANSTIVPSSFSPETSEKDGILTVAVPENNTKSAAQVRLRIKAEGSETNIYEYVIVTLSGKPFVEVDNSSIELPASGGGRLVHVSASSAWSAKGVTVTKAGTNDSWCSATALEASNNIELNLSADANNTGAARYAQFVLSLDNDPTVKCTVEVCQPSL